MKRYKVVMVTVCLSVYEEAERIREREKKQYVLTPSTILKV